MPKRSQRQELIGEVEQCLKFSAMMFLLNEEDSYSEEEDENIPAYQPLDSGLECYYMLANIHRRICSQRFLTVRKKLPKSRDFATDYFLEQPDDDFRRITRVNKPTFFFILSKIEGHPIFQNRSQCPQLPIHWQLACFLDRVGNDGQGVSLARSKSIWGLGHGTIHLYMNRCITALLAIEADWLRWPNAVQRASISKRLARKGFKDCVGFVDGTTLPLHKKPAEDANSYMNTKNVYSVNAQIVCDDRRRITHLMVGDPGSAHDASVFEDSPLVQMASLCFAQNEYLIADSDYAATSHLVPAYKENQRDDDADRLEPRKIEIFNTRLAKLRMVNEHTIGVLKSRWPCLSALKIDINVQSDITKVVRLVRACVILHNMSLGHDPWTDEQLADDGVTDSGSVAFEQPQPTTLTEGQQKRWAVRKDLQAFLERQEGGIVETS